MRTKITIKGTVSPYTYAHVATKNTQVLPWVAGKTTWLW